MYSEENATIKATYQGASKTTAGQLGSVFTNLSEYTRMVRRLDDVAPDDIGTDMHAAREAWDQQADLAAQAAKDPLGALAGSLMSSMMNAASYSHVDTWSQQHCGGTVFGFGQMGAGFGATSAGRTASRTPTPTPTAAEGCPTHAANGDGAPLAATLAGKDGASLATLTSAVTRMRTSSDASLAAAAGPLADALAGLAPTPASATEALHRLNMANGALEPTLAAIDSAATTACLTPAFGALDSFHRGGPVTAGDGTTTGWKTLDGLCNNSGDPLGWSPPFTYVAQCGPDVYSVDLKTGVVSKATMPAGFVPGTHPVVVGTRVASTTVTKNEAQGLTAVTYTAVLNLQNLDGSQPVSVPLFTKVPSDQTPNVVFADSTLDVVTVSTSTGGGSTPERTLSTYRADSGALVKTQAVADDKVPNDGLRVNATFSERLLRDGTRWDAETGALIPGSAYASYVTDGGCLKRALTRGDKDMMTIDDGTQATTTSASSGLQTALESARQIVGVTASGVLVGTDSGYAMLDFSGRQRWLVPAAVAKDAKVVLGHPLLANGSKTWVVTDAETGKEATGLPPTVTTDLVNAAGAYQSPLLDIEPTLNWIIVSRGDGVALATYKDYCAA